MDWLGCRAVFRVLFLSLLLMFGPGSSLSGNPRMVFERTATEYRRAVAYCWGVRKAQPSAWEHRQIVKACAKWAEIRWPDYTSLMRERLYRLYLSEGENPADPSYGWWGVTLPAARSVGRKYPVKGYRLPKSDKALAKRLRRDIDFNCCIASGELAACMVGLPMTYETKAVMRYKLGFRGEREFKKNKRTRRRAWFAIRRQWRCLEKQVEADVSDPCECMRESGRAK